ncbi:MAG: hypothetical protein KDD77_00990, partial [Caldilineaceae bacterium]|nr:hypothetical protein [Caldilineaceae bacterium]
MTGGDRDTLTIECDGSISAAYTLEWNSAIGRPIKPVREYRLASLLEVYGSSLWENGSHKRNVVSFIGELDELVQPRRFSAFSQQMLDQLIAALRDRGNSNATINRKIAALSKLLRKAHKMGDIHSLPEFRRQKERQGR